MPGFYMGTGDNNTITKQIQDENSLKLSDFPKNLNTPNLKFFGFGLTIKEMEELTKKLINPDR